MINLKKKKIDNENKTNNNHSKINSFKLTKKTIIIFILIITIIITSSIILTNNLTHHNNNENITTKLNSDTDFLNWFIDFDKLYNKKIKNIKYSVTSNMFEKVVKLLNEDNYTEISYKDNIYYITDNDTLELDTNTRSFRYTKYKDNKKIEILEVNLINGKYYIQLVNTTDIYKIILNNKTLKKKHYKNKESVIIKESIFNTNDFNW